MIKRDLIEHIYRLHGGLSRSEVKQNVEILLDEIRRGVVAHGSLVISGFGTFKLKGRPAREVILPDGQKRRTSPEPRIRFYPARNLKAALNPQRTVDQEAPTPRSDVEPKKDDSDS